MLTDEMKQELIRLAKEVRQWAYAPYSNYPVGAAVLAESGRIYTGVNVENASYPVGICGERAAIQRAIAEGEREFVAIAVVTANGGSPCGACRQVMAEFALQMRVLIANDEGQVTLDTTVSELLPGAFLPGHLASK
jgi:cytidine deaminase